MAKYGKKILIGTAIVAVLILAFIFGGGNTSETSKDNPTKITQQQDTVHKDSKNSDTKIDNSISQNEQKDDNQNENSTSDNNKNNKSNAPVSNSSDDRVTDEYNTLPVPDGKPEPVEPQNTEIEDTALKCTLSVRCDTILNNLKSLNPEKTELVPKDGVIYSKKEVVFYDGESVFNVLLREMKKNKIHMEFTNTPIYNSAYIEGIANLYEFDCGDLSGWMYKVNDWFPNYGCSRYKLKNGDNIEWVYTCDLGKDVGEDYSSYGGQKDE